MESTRKRPPAEIAARVAGRLDRLVPDGARVAVGLSGGADSVALLHLAAGIAARSSVSPRFTLSAIHVHHGLSAHADAWAAHCESLCAALGVPLVVVRVQVPRDADEGIEAAARAARHRVFAQCDADCVLLAHHEDDQAETLLLQLARGAGVAGLAGMPAVLPVPTDPAAPDAAPDASPDAAPARPHLVRPLLAIARAELREYATAHGLAWVEDDSNADRRFRRNRLRLDVMPLLATLQPGVAPNLARVARHLGEAADLLREWGGIDAAAAREGAGWSVARLAALGPARGRNALRAILVEAGLRAPTTRRLDEAWRQLVEARPQAAVAVAVAEEGGPAVRRYRGVLHLVPGALPPSAASVEVATAGAAGVLLAWPGGAVRLDPATGAGLDAGRVARGRLTLRARVGGERFRPVGSGHHRTLKNLWQERAVPPWERSRRPLLYVDETLAWVPGVGVAADLAAPAGGAGRMPVWVGA